MLHTDRTFNFINRLFENFRLVSPTQNEQAFLLVKFVYLFQSGRDLKNHLLFRFFYLYYMYLG